MAQALSVGATAALMLSGAPSPIVYAAAVIASCAVTLTRPAQSALLPALVETPAQLTAANVVSGWVENVSVLAGPLIASVVLVSAGPGWAMTVFAVVVASSAVAVGPLRELRRGSVDEDEEERESSLAAAIRTAPGALPALAMLTAEYAVLGALDVLEVVLAATVLGLGAGGAGYLGAVFGAGGLVGAAAALALVGRHRLARPLLLVRVTRRGAPPSSRSAPGPRWARPSACWRSPAPAVRCSTSAGGPFSTARSRGNSTGGSSVLWRAWRWPGSRSGLWLCPCWWRSRGTRGDRRGHCGGLLIVVPVLTTPALRDIERAAPALDVELGILRGGPLFAMLSAPVLEDLARALTRFSVSPGDTVTREGGPGHDYFLVAEGGVWRGL